MEKDETQCQNFNNTRQMSDIKAIKECVIVIVL